MKRQERKNRNNVCFNKTVDHLGSVLLGDHLGNCTTHFTVVSLEMERGDWGFVPLLPVSHWWNVDSEEVNGLRLQVVSKRQFSKLL